MQPSSPGAGSTDVKKVMISSTALDLPEHRNQLRDACLRQGMFPVMMEYLPASDAEAIAESLRMVNEADLYLGNLPTATAMSPKATTSRSQRWSTTALSNETFPGCSS